MHLEENFFLLLNRQFWNVKAVNSILTEKYFFSELIFSTLESIEIIYFC